jgi:hypothetical protein
VHRPRVTFANVVSCLALFVALGGASYAAVALPKNSVGAKQIVAGTIDNSKIKKGSLLSTAFKPGQLLAGKDGAQGPAGLIGAKGDTGAQGPPGPGNVSQIAGMSAIPAQTITADNQWHTWAAVTWTAEANTLYMLYYDDDYALRTTSGAPCNNGHPESVQRGLVNGVVVGSLDSYGYRSIPTFYGPYPAGTTVTVENQYQQLCATETQNLPPGQILAVPYRTP